MPRPNKYLPGNKKTCIHELIALLRLGCWVYWHGRPKHPSFLLSMQLNALIGIAGKGLLRLAVPNEQPEKDNADAVASD